jgi:hypothetical protein
VAFYVPLGPRGLLLRVGTFVIGILGGLTYGLACRRRRSLIRPIAQPITIPVLD